MSAGALTSISIKNFTAFEQLDLELSPGVNIFIGPNSTGKTHLLKLMYSICSSTRPKAKPPEEKLLAVFAPRGEIAKLIHRGSDSARVALAMDGQVLEFELHTDPTGHGEPMFERWGGLSVAHRESVYIPAKEMLANAPGFRSLYQRYDIDFEEVYFDILEAAYSPLRRTSPETMPEPLLTRLKETLGGHVIVEGETFYLRKGEWRLPFGLLAEGLRKLGLLWLLVWNDCLKPGTFLFWDEPEANLNPSLIGLVVEVILQLQRVGVQALLATHNYVVLKEFDLRCRKDDLVRYHSLYRDVLSGRIFCKSTDEYVSLDPNDIVDTYVQLYERDVVRDFREAGSLSDGPGRS